MMDLIDHIWVKLKKYRQEESICFVTGFCCQTFSETMLKSVGTDNKKKKKKKRLMNTVAAKAVRKNKKQTEM